MKNNVSPHWTSTGVPQEDHPALPAETESMQRNGEVSGMQEGTRIQVRRGMPKRIAVTLGITLSVSGASFLGYLFLEGVGSLQANITGEMVPDHVIELSEKGFADVSVSAGELLEFRNTLKTMEQYRSEIPDEKTGMPLMATPTIPPAETVRLRVPAEAAGKDVLLISGFDPSRRGLMKVIDGGLEEKEDAEEPEEEKESEDFDIPLPMLSGKPSSSSSSSASSAASVTSPPASPAIVRPVPPAVPVPSMLLAPVAPLLTPPVNTQPEILNLGPNTAQNMIVAAWPAHLRTNRYTIGSPFVPDLSPIVAVRFGGTPHNAAKDQAPVADTLKGVHRAPDTGPSLWILVALSMCVAPVYFVRRAR